jgi:hypothetical protein
MEPTISFLKETQEFCLTFSEKDSIFSAYLSIESLQKLENKIEIAKERAKEPKGAPAGQ